MLLKWRKLIKKGDSDGPVLTPEEEKHKKTSDQVDEELSLNQVTAIS